MMTSDRRTKVLRRALNRCSAFNLPRSGQSGTDLRIPQLSLLLCRKQSDCPDSVEELSPTSPGIRSLTASLIAAGEQSLSCTQFCLQVRRAGTNRVVMDPVLQTNGQLGCLRRASLPVAATLACDGCHEPRRRRVRLQSIRATGRKEQSLDRHYSLPYRVPSRTEDTSTLACTRLSRR